MTPAGTPAAPSPEAGEPPLLLGVCAGLAGRLRVRARWVRGAALILLAATWVTALVYAALALLLPAQGEEGLPWRLRLDLRWRTLGESLGDARLRAEGLVTRWAEGRGSPSPQQSLRALAGGGLLLVGLAVFLWSLPWIEWLNLQRALGLGLALLGVGLLGERR